jgi:hypothetical protein
MATLTSEQQSRLRRKLAIADADQTIFTDAQYNDMYTEAEADFNFTIVLAIRDLLMGAAKLSKYTQGQSSEDPTMIAENLRKMLDYYESVVPASLTGGIAMAGMRSVPTIVKDVPAERPEHPDEKNRRHDGVNG